MLLRMSALLVWALAAAGAVFWGVRGFAAGKPVPPGTPMAMPAPVVTNGPLVKLFGLPPRAVEAAPEVAPEESRFKLLGVVAPKHAGSAGGVAVIAVDNQPAKHFRVGTAIDGDAVLLAVSARGAEVGPRGGPAAFDLQLPDPESLPRPSMPAQPGMVGRTGIQAPNATMPPIQGALPPHQALPMPGRPQPLPTPNGVPVQPQPQQDVMTDEEEEE